MAIVWEWNAVVLMESASVVWLVDRMDFLLVESMDWNSAELKVPLRVYEMA